MNSTPNTRAKCRTGTALARPRRSQSKFPEGDTVDTRMNEPGRKLRFYMELNKATGKARWEHMAPAAMVRILNGIIAQARYSKNADQARRLLDTIRQKSTAKK